VLRIALAKGQEDVETVEEELGFTVRNADTLGDGWGARNGDVSWNDSNPVCVYAPSTGTSWLYAAVAARMALVLAPYDPAQAAAYRESAVRAWRWAAAQPTGDKTGAGQGDAPWLAAHQAEAAAAVALFACTRDQAYHERFKRICELQVEVATAYDGQGIEPMLLLPVWNKEPDPIERVFALLESYRQRLVITECTYGCPIGSIALELHEPDPAVRERLAANFDAWVAAIEACFVEAGSRLPDSVDRRGLAVMALTSMEGGVMLSRTHRTLDAFDDAVRMYRDYLERLQLEAAR